MNFRKLKASATATFLTQTGVYPVVARSESGVVPNDSVNAFNNGFISFDTQNDSSNETAMPTATITLTDDYDWSTLLTPNDYVRIDIEYRGDTFADEAGQTITICVYCGMISDITRTTSSENNNRTYVVTAQGMAKILKNINLSTFSEITSTDSAYVLLPDDAKTGIRFSQRTSANIVNQVLTKFVLGSNDYLDYGFFDLNLNSVKVTDLLGTDIQENLDESFANEGYNKFSNYNGSLLAMLNDIAAKPFNELYWTHEEGIATLHYRPTPFDPDRWNLLDRITIDGGDIIDDQTSTTDQEQYSIFKLYTDSGIGSTIYTSGWSGHLAPLTNQSLIRRYGYLTMEVTVDYFNGNEAESSSVSDTTGSKNVNLSSRIQGYTALAKEACSDNSCSDLYPYLLAIAQLENGSDIDPINASSHGGSSINTVADSFDFGAKLLKSYQSTAEGYGINDKLAIVQAYNFGEGFLSYMNEESAKTLSITVTENYSEKIAKANGNATLTKKTYTNAITQKYGKNYLYVNGADFFYGFEAQQYIGSGSISSSTNTSNNSNPSSEGTTEAEAKLHYPLYENIEDIFAYILGLDINSDITLPQSYGGVSLYNSVVSLLKDGYSRSKFVAQATSLSSIITSDYANSIYTQYNNTNTKLTRSSYLSIIAPLVMQTSSNVSASASYLKSKNKIKNNPKSAASELIQETNYRLGSKQAYEIIETIINDGSISDAQYESILSKYPYADTEDGVTSYSSTSSTSLDSVPYMFSKYTQKLFNWYADNTKFHSGTITINGTSGIEIGKRLLIYDYKDSAYFEFYVESVSHSWSYSSGWITTIGVTRGLPLTSSDDQRRFTNPYSFWGMYISFAGGYFGEPNLAAALASSNADDSDSDSDGDDDDTTSGPTTKGSTDAMKALSYAKSFTTKKTKYSMAYHSVDMFTQSEPIKGDCSGLIFWCFREVGVNVSADGASDTLHIRYAPTVTTVTTVNSDKNTAFKKLHEGDIVFFSIDSTDDHCAFYQGNNKCIGFNVTNGVESFSLKGNSYWWQAWKGHICRVE